MVKSPASMWEAKRNKHWIKFKPDYLDALDIDAVVIAAWHGAGSRGQGTTGERLSEFLMALALPQKGSEELHFASFCRSAPFLALRGVSRRLV